MLKGNSRLGVIDLGTNTFHLLIVEKQRSSFTEIFRLREHIFLAENSIEFIGEAAMQRALQALKVFKEKLALFEVNTVHIVGTAALRRAKNAEVFIQQVKEICGLEIQVISGQREAELIAKGTRLAMSNIQDNYLVMDIGGGSVEFILMNQVQIFWYQSFPLGVAILKKKFHHTEPILKNDIKALRTFLEQQLNVLRDQCLKYRPSTLVGASGSFEVMSQISSIPTLPNQLGEIPLSAFNHLADKIIASNLQERKDIPRLTESRVELIVVAVLLMQYVLEISKTKNILVSPYALKEGIIAEIYNF